MGFTSFFSVGTKFVFLFVVSSLSGCCCCAGIDPGGFESLAEMKAFLPHWSQ